MRYKVRWEISGETYLDAKDEDDAADLLYGALECASIYLPEPGASTDYDGPSILGVFDADD